MFQEEADFWTAKECRENAMRAQSAAERAAWLELADDWMRLAHQMPTVESKALREAPLGTELRSLGRDDAVVSLTAERTSMLPKAGQLGRLATYRTRLTVATFPSGSSPRA